MTERICEHCGQQFLSETIWDKLENTAMLMAVFGLPIHVVDCFREGWHGVFAGLFWLFVIGSAIYELYRRSNRKKGEVVKFGRTCPSCGDRTAHVDSPLGEQLIEYWSSPQTQDQQDIVEEPLTISGEGEETETVVSHNGSPCE